MSVIRLSNIDKSFGQVHALKDINIDIQSGEFFTLLGPSGCGKTTLLRIIAGFYNQDRGSIHIGERTMDGVPPYDRDTGMVFQNYAVFPHMTVFENVAFGLRNRRVPADEIRRRVASALETARLTGYEERTPDQLSGGQQQRVGLARALVIEPQVLLMDEPLSNLDAKLRLQMREEIRDIQRQLGITTVYVTHDQEEALVISDRIAVMNLGQIQQIGSAWDVYKRPANVFAAAFVGHMNFVEATLQAESGKRVFRVEGASETFDASPWRSLPAGVWRTARVPAGGSRHREGHARGARKSPALLYRGEEYLHRRARSVHAPRQKRCPDRGRASPSGNRGHHRLRNGGGNACQFLVAPSLFRGGRNESSAGG